VKTLWSILKQAVRQLQEDRAFELAAGLAFYSVISLAPLITVILSVATFFYGAEAVRGELMHQVEYLLGSQGAELVQTILANAKQGGSGIFGIVGLVMLLISASAVFIQLQSALNTIWQVAPRPDLSWGYTIRLRLVSMALVVGAGMFLILLVILSAVLAAVAAFITKVAPSVQSLWGLVDLVFSIGVLTFLFAMIFKILPDAVIRWKDVWPGAFTTAILFALGKLAISLYLGKSAPGSAYGAAGSVIALLLWVYYSAVILFFGAELTQVYAGRFGTRIQPAAHAYRVSSMALPVDEDGNPILRGEKREEVKQRVKGSSEERSS
jgi:membrane protein